MEHISGIYKIENLINHKLYIGQSDDLYRRRDAHFNELKGNRHYNQHLQRSYNKYGKDNFKFNIVEKCNVDLLDEREIYWIQYFDSFNNGYNQNLGGNSNRGWVATDETKRKMRENHADVSGENNPMYGVSLYDVLGEDAIKGWINKISIANTGENNAFYGRHHTDIAKEKISKSNKGRKLSIDILNRRPPLSNSHKQKMRDAYNLKYKDNHPNSHAVICLNTMCIYKSVTYASEITGIHESSISVCCNKDTNHFTAGTIDDICLVWMYLEDYWDTKNKLDIKQIIKDANNKRKHKGEFSLNARKVICLNTEKIFYSAMEAGKYYSVDNSSISKCCKKTKNSAGKDILTGKPLQWMFYEDYINNQVKAC